MGTKKAIRKHKACGHYVGGGIKRAIFSKKCSASMHWKALKLSNA